MTISFARTFARGSLGILLCSAVTACAAQVVNSFDDAGDSCASDPTTCVDAHADSSSHHDGSAQHDSSSIDAPTADSPLGDASGIDSGGDAGIDSSVDASVDSAPDAAPDSAPDSAPDTGTVDAGPLLFDSLTGTQGSSTRGTGDSCGTKITVTTGATITAIAVKNTLVPTDAAVSNIKFMIWDGTTLVYISPPKAFAVTGDSWKESDLLSYTLVAGHQYSIGGISDASGTWDYDTTIESANGISSTTQNPNWTNYTTPALSSSGGADCAIRLYR